MADTKLANLTALTAPSGDDLLYVVDDPAGTPADRKLALNNLFTRGTVTADSPIIDAAQTWNNAAVTFTALKLNVTNTASASGSLLMDLQVGGTSYARLQKNGLFTLQATDAEIAIGYTNETNLRLQQGGPILCNTGALAWSSSLTAVTGANRDLFLTRRAAANIRLGAADAAAPVAQTLSVQSVVAGTTNTAGANLTITGSQGTGTGAGGSIVFQVAPAGTTGSAQNALTTAWQISGAGHLLAGTDNTYDIGASGGTRPRNVFLNGYVRTENSLRIEDGSGAFGVRMYRVSSSAGVLTLYNSGETGFDRLQFGGTSSSFPALKRSSAILQARLADDSGYTTMDAQHRLQGTAPAANNSTGTAGDIRYDADYIYICTATDTWKRVAIAW